MTNEELKKKICKIIAPYVSAWGEDERIADALIAAGIVDKSDYASMKETAVRYKAEVSKAGARVKEAELRAEVAESELERYTALIKPLEAENTRLKHRAAMAERALDKAVNLFYEYRIESDVLSCSSCWIADEAFKRCEVQGLYKGCPQRWKEEMLIQAEKELAEEDK